MQRPPILSGPPTVSVVIPAYNHERFVGEAIASAQAQTLTDLEIVVVDDGSRDATATIAESIAARDARVRVIRQPNGGSHAAINRGIAESRAPWIAILNSDDRYHPERLHTMVAACGDGFDFAVGDARLIDARGDAISDPDHWWLRANRETREYAREHGPIHGLLHGNYTISTSNFVFRRTLADAIGRFRPLRHIVDWEFAIRAALHDPARFLYLQDQALFDYRIHGGNAILSNLLRGALEIEHMHRALLPQLGVPPGLVQALFRTQRDIRRHARDRAVQPIARIAQEREADRLQLAAELDAVRTSLVWRVLRRLGFLRLKG